MLFSRSRNIAVLKYISPNIYGHKICIDKKEHGHKRTVLPSYLKYPRHVFYFTNQGSSCRSFTLTTYKKVSKNTKLLFSGLSIWHCYIFTESYTSAHVFLHLLNELRKRDIMHVRLNEHVSLFCNDFHKFNNTGA